MLFYGNIGWNTNLFESELSTARSQLLPVSSRLDLPAAGPGGGPLVRQRDLLQTDPRSRVVHGTPALVPSLRLRYQPSPQCI